MHSLDSYLKHHYQTADQLAAACSISVDELAALVREQLVPEPSYTVLRSDTLVSQAFGELSVQGATPGQYFHPGNAAWVALALEAKARLGSAAAQLELKERFRNNFAVALQEIDKTLFRLQDSFSDTGDVLVDGLAARTESAWGYFLKGVFSLCVADPSSEKSIAYKEVLQEALTELTDGGSRDDLSPDGRQFVLKLIDQYAEAAMPFSPPEYPNSSRKRLVEDLRAKLGASVAGDSTS